MASIALSYIINQFKFLINKNEKSMEAKNNKTPKSDILILSLFETVRSFGISAAVTIILASTLG